MPHDAPRQGSRGGAHGPGAEPPVAAETVDTRGGRLTAPPAADGTPPEHTLAVIAAHETHGWNQWPKMLGVSGSLGVVVAALILTSMTAHTPGPGTWFRAPGDRTAEVSSPAPSGTAPDEAATASPAPSGSGSPTVAASGAPATPSAAPDAPPPSPTSEPGSPAEERTGPVDDASSQALDDPEDPDPGADPAPAEYTMVSNDQSGELRAACRWSAGDLDAGDSEPAEAGGRFELAYRTCPEQASYVATSRPATILGSPSTPPPPQDCEEAARSGEPLDVRVDDGGLPAGTTFCTTTDENRIAYVVVTGYTRNLTMTFDLTTWEITN